MAEKSSSDWMMQIFGWTGFIAIAVYAIYSVETGTGLGGWLVDLQLQWFGQYATKITVLVVVIVLCVGGVLIFVALQKLYDLLRSKETAAEDSVIQNIVASPATPQKENPAAVLWVGLAIFAGSLITGGGAYLFLHWKHEGERGSEFERVRLDPRISAAEPRGKFVALEAVAQPKFIYALRHQKTNRTDYYAPLTGPDWTEREPVRYVLALTERSVKLSRADVSGPFYVQAERDGLPKYVVTEYQKAGLALATPYYAVSPVPVENGRVGSREKDDSVILIVGGIMAAIGLIFVIVGLIVYRVKTAKARATSANL